MRITNYLCILLLFFPALVFGQQNITGKVTDAQGPMPGVSIKAVIAGGQKTVAITDQNGAFKINVAANVAELMFSFQGMITVTEKISGRNVINVQLKENTTELENVVVTALGIKRETKALSYSRQSMDVSTLTEAPSTNIVSALSGRIAGVQITPPSTNTGSARVIIRGNNSITGNNQPLFVIDGIPVDNETGDKNVTTSGNLNLDYGNVAANINPEDIQSIEVLKGPNAAALYGSRAANGAILITTKKSGGKAFKTTFSSNATFQRISEFPDYQNMFGKNHARCLAAAGIILVSH